MENISKVELAAQSEPVCVLGLGFVGLTLSLVLADKGFKVYGVDINQKIIDGLLRKEPPFYEDNLANYLDRYVGNRFIPTTEMSEAASDTYIISVGTPIDAKTHKPITKFIQTATRSINKVLKKGDLVVLRSTVPIGLSRSLVIPILSETGLKIGSDFSVAFAPERTAEGRALAELTELPQIVGGYDQHSLHLVESLFRRLTNSVLNAGSLEGAEMVKILNNTFRDVKFGYVNQMALVCQEMGLDLPNLIGLANNGYVRDRIPTPSPGVGGACLSKDPYILIDSCKNLENKPEIVRHGRMANEQVPTNLVLRMLKSLKKLNKKTEEVKIFIAGFAFKGEPETDDLRDSNTLDVIAELNNHGVPSANIYGYDFLVNSQRINSCGANAVEIEEGFRDADVVFIMNNHTNFRKLRILSLLQMAKDDCIFIDGWRLYRPENITSVNKVSYLGVGSEYGS